MIKPQETKNQTNELNLTQIREWLWQLSQNKTCQDWEQLQEVLKSDYENFDEYEKEHTINNYRNFVINHLINWGIQRHVNK